MTFTEVERHHGIKFSDDDIDLCFTHYFLNLFVAQAPGGCCKAPTEYSKSYFHCHRSACCLCRGAGCLFGCTIGTLMDTLMHITYPCGACLYGCECCHFKDCDSCTKYPRKYHAFFEVVECEKEWRYKNEVYNDTDGVRRHRNVRYKHTVRSSVTESKKSDEFEVKSTMHFYRVLCCEYAENANPKTFCPECGEPGSDCAYCNCC
jgi:hypothetical protein